MKLLIHTIAAFGINAINKGEDGEIKNIDHIGYRAQRVSSQCVKRAAREALGQQGIELGHRLSSTQVWGLMRETANPSTEAEFAELYANYCTLLGIKPKAAKAAVKKLNEQLGSETEADEPTEDDSKEGETGNTMYFAAPGQVEAAAKGEFDGHELTVDIALFGRMVPQGRGTVNGAMFTSGWLGISELSESGDFFTASPDDVRQAVSMGYTSYAGSSVLYGFHGIDLNILSQNLPHATAEDKARYVAATVRAFVEAEPTGGRHNFNGFATPNYVFTEVSPRNVSAIEEFVYEPVLTDGEAVKRLREHTTKARNFEGRDGATAEAYRTDGTSLADLYAKVEADVLSYYRG